MITLLCSSHWPERYCHGNMCVCNTLQWGGTEYRESQEQHSAGLILLPSIAPHLSPLPHHPPPNPSSALMSSKTVKGGQKYELGRKLLWWTSVTPPCELKRGWGGGSWLQIWLVSWLCPADRVELYLLRLS